MKLYRSLFLWMMLIIFFAGALPVRAAPAVDDGDIDDPADLELFSDEFFTEKMDAYNVPGAVFVVVKDGEIVFEKGYGYTDLETKNPIDPQSSMFCAGSVGKLYTWTALMQLYENGMIDLNDDVNNYLEEFQIEDTYPEPITFYNLLTHTTGFDDRSIGIWPEDMSGVQPLGEYLAEWLPERIREPGQVTQYSNFGAGLAGYLVEVISGEPYADYIDNHIFEPLDMQHSTFQQPIPQTMQADLVTGYMNSNGELIPQPVHVTNIMPAGMAYFSADDMAHFMIAHLQNGRYEDARILSEETAQLMHEQHFANHESLPGMAYGFIEGRENGHRMIWHTGTSPDFHNLLMLLPKENTGIFMSSSIVDRRLSHDLREEFMDRFYPLEVETLQPSAEDAIRLQSFEGTYRFNWHSHNYMDKISALSYDITVQATESGSLLTQTENAAPIEWIPVDEMVFRLVDEDEYLAFGTDQNGEIHYLFQDTAPIAAYERLAWYEDVGLQGALLIFSGLVFLSYLLSMLIGFIVRLFRKQKAKKQPGAARLARWLGTMLSITPFLFLVGFLFSLSKLITGNIDILFYLVMTLSVMMVVLAAAVIFLAVCAWALKYWRTGARVHYSLLALAGLLTILVFYYWNLIGFRF